MFSSAKHELHRINCGGNVRVSGRVNYRGHTNVTCQQDHHACYCDDWAMLLLSFREVLSDFEHYKKVCQSSLRLFDTYQKLEEQIEGISYSVSEARAANRDFKQVNQNLIGALDRIQMFMTALFPLLEEQKSTTKRIVRHLKEAAEEDVRGLVREQRRN